MNNIKLAPSLLIFAEIAKQRSFTKAATHLGMSKSAVSQQLSKLETSIGQKLITRTTRGMSLTEAGEKVLNRSQLLTHQVELALQEIAAAKAMPSGRFAVTIPHSLERNIAIPALAQLCQEFPGIEPELVVSDFQRDLTNDNLDVAISAGELKDSHYRALPLGTATEIICTSPRYLATISQPAHLKTLEQCKWIMTPWQKDTATLFNRKKPSSKKTINFTSTARTNTLPSAIEMLVQHMGVGLLPKFVLQELLSTGRLVQLMPNYQGRSWSFHFVHRFLREKPVHVSRFYELIKFYFNQSVNS